MNKVDTPCIGVCSTVYGDKVCRGCKRHFDEVIDWLAYTPEQKMEVYERLNEHMTEIVAKYITVYSIEKLKTTLEVWSIRFRDDEHPLSWAMHLLMHGDEKIESAESVGLIVHEGYQKLSFTDLCNTIDRDLYQHAMTAFEAR